MNRRISLFVRNSNVFGSDRASGWQLILKIKKFSEVSRFLINFYFHYFKRLKPEDLTCFQRMEGEKSDASKILEISMVSTSPEEH